MDREPQSWIQQLPASKMIYPTSLWDRIKYYFWFAYTPLHSFLRDLTVGAGIVRHSGRQDYLLGTLAPGETAESLARFLVTQGFGNHFVAWKDDGEIVSLRLVENFFYQYHIRIFGDGEVRAHYEYTPESYPILHMKEVGQEDRRQYFLGILGSRIIPTRG